MRILIHLLLIIAFAELHFCDYAKSYNNKKGIYNIGKHEGYEEVLTEVTIKKRKPTGIGFDKQVHGDVIFDSRKSSGNIKRITAIEATPEVDTEFGSKPGSLQFIEGGIEKENVQLRFLGQKGYGLIYKVKIYGKS